IYTLSLHDALPISTQLIYKSSKLNINNPSFNRRQELYLDLINTTPAIPTVTPLPLPISPSSASAVISPTKPAITNQPSPTPAPAKKEEPKPLPSKEELRQTVDLAKQAQAVQGKILETEEKLNKIRV